MKLNIYHDSKLAFRMAQHLVYILKEIKDNKIDYEIFYTNEYTDNENKKYIISLRCIVIEDATTKRFKILDCYDKFGGGMHCRGFLESNYLDFCLKSNFSPNFVAKSKIKNVAKCRPWTWFAGNPNVLNNNIIQLRDIQSTNKKMYFRGKPWANRRKFMRELQDVNILDAFYTKLDGLEYYKEMKQYRISFSPTGNTYNCFRDIESIGLGIPTLMWERPTIYYNHLKANHHFISFSNIEDKEHDKNIFNSKLIIEKYNSVIDNKEFLDFISYNAIQWYEENASLLGFAKLTYKLLEL